MEWAFLETGTKFERVRRGIPPPQSWFLRPAARTPYAAGARLKDAGHSRGAEDFRAVLQEAPFDYDAASGYLLAKHGQHPPYDEAHAVHSPRLEYDLRALRAVRTLVAAADERVELMRHSCEISPTECISLGGELVRLNRASEGALAYERAFADPSVDEVAMSNSSAWLVTYYFRQGRMEEARALAQRSAGTGSFMGLVTAAYLYERAGQWRDAEDAYSEAAARYDNPSQLLGFYYRAIHKHKQAQFEPRWKIALERVFPQGLAGGPFDDGQPTRGVVVTKDDEQARKAGLQAGDLVIGLEGWHIETLEQFRAVNAFYENDLVRVTAWRGKAFTVDIPAAGRRLGVEFRTYPVQGWSER
jgi:tetratricopeptide (TPR) repeat protein